MTATREEILAAAVATSDRLNAEDLIGGPLTITIKDVHVIKGDKGVQKMIIDIEGREHPWHTCKSVTRTILAMWQDEPVQWIGRQMVLYRDPDVVFKNDPLGGIRIQSASHLAEAFTLTLTEHQKKRITRTIKPLAAVDPPKLQQPSITDRVERAMAAYRACKTADELIALGDKSEQLRAECDDVNKLKLTTVFESAMRRINEQGES